MLIFHVMNIVLKIFGLEKKTKAIWKISIFVSSIFVGFLFLDIPVAYTQEKDLNLRWEANGEPDLEGYEVHYAPISDGLDSITVRKVVLKLRGVADTQRFDEELSSNTNPHYTLKGLDNSINYVIALKAYDSEGLVSGFSEKCSKAHGCDGSSDDGNDDDGGDDGGGGGGGGGGGCFILRGILQDH